MTRDDARQAFQDAGLDYAVLDKQSLATLRAMIDKEMRASGCIRGSFRAGRAAVLKHIDGKPHAEIRCQSFYFTRREAVTFNSDGFIGFAGWSDDNNIQPILTAFVAWAGLMKQAIAA